MNARVQQILQPEIAGCESVTVYGWNCLRHGLGRVYWLSTRGLLKRSGFLEHLSVVADYYGALGCDIVDLARRVREIYLDPEADDADRRPLMRLLFSNIGPKASEVNGKFTPGFGVLSEFTLGWNEKFERQENTMNTPQEGQFDATLTELLKIADDFGTINWAKEYPAPDFTIEQIRELLAG